MTEITNEELEVEYVEFTKEDFEGDTYSPEDLEDAPKPCWFYDYKN